MNGSDGLAEDRQSMNVRYVVTRFPAWSETFVLGEMVDHARAGTDIGVLSLRPCSESVVQPAATRFVPRTTYAPALFNPVLLTLHALLLARQPREYVSMLAAVLRIRPFSALRTLKSLMVWWLSAWFIRAVREEHVTYLHAHFATYTALLARIVHAFTGVSYSFTAHAYDLYVDRSLLRLVAERAGTIITISRFNKELIESHLGDSWRGRVEVVRCGIDVSEFAYTPRAWGVRHDEPVRIVSVGRLSGIKGFPYLLGALAGLKQAGTRFHCRIVGDGPDRGRLESRARLLGLEHDVTFLGAIRQDEVRREMNDADLFVLACATDPKEGHDGIPVVFMEAMALGTPVVGTRLSGIPELVREGETGLLAAAESADSLRDSIQYACEHPEQMEAMRVRARRLIEEEFDIAKTAARLRALFRDAPALASLHTPSAIQDPVSPQP